MSLRLLAMVATLFTTMIAGPVLADVTITHKQAGFCFDVPDNWEREVDEDNPDLLMVTSPEWGISIQSWVIDAKDLDDAIDGLAEGLDEQFDDVELDEKVEEATINDLDRVALHGTAKLEGEPVLLSIVIVIAEKPVIFLAMGAPDSITEHREALDAISASIRPAE